MFSFVPGHKLLFALLFMGVKRERPFEEPNIEDSITILEGIKADAHKADGDKNVLLFLSGGVDSTIAFALVIPTPKPHKNTDFSFNSL